LAGYRPRPRLAPTARTVAPQRSRPPAASIRTPRRSRKPMTDQHGGCPFHTDSERKAIKPRDASPGRVAKRGTMWRIGSLTAAKDVLLARHETIQAGFTAEYIPRNAFRNHPILISD